MKTKPNKGAYQLRPFAAVCSAALQWPDMAGASVQLVAVSREVFLQMTQQDPAPLGFPVYFYANNSLAELHLWPRPDKSYEIEVITQPWPEKQ